MANDEVPETLIPVLKILADDFVPETLAAADFIDRWLAERQPDPGAVAVRRLAEALGAADFILRGEAIMALAKPDRFYWCSPFTKPLLYLQVGSRQKSEHCWRHVAWRGL